MLKLIKRWPLFVILCPIFFVLHAVNAYFRLIGYDVIYYYLTAYILGSLVAFLISFLFTRSPIKAGLITVYFQIVFFFWGSIHDFIRKLSYHSFFSRYTFLLPFLLVITIVYLIFFRRLQRYYQRLHLFFNTIFIIFTVLELAILAYNAATKTKLSDVVYATQSPTPIDTLPQIADSAKPDIFFLVFDEYASSVSLKKYYGFDNSQTDSLLERSGFFIVRQSKSNYNGTPFSICSTFNMDYFGGAFAGRRLNAKELLKVCNSVPYSLILKLLGDNGYKIVNDGVFPLAEAQTLMEPYFKFQLEDGALFGATLAGRIRRDILWNASNRQIPFVTKWYKNEMDKDAFFNINRNRKNFGSFLNEIKGGYSGPKFVYGHLILPHFPFLVDTNGNYTGDGYLNLFDTSGYLRQVRYANKLIRQVNEVILNTPSARKRIVIIEGDHGFRDASPPPSKRAKQFENFDVIYFSDHDYSTLYDSISPVNTFRVVLNKYFHTSLPLLKDSTVLLP